MRVILNALSVPSCRQGGAGFYTGMLVDGLSRSDEVECQVLASARVAEELEELAPGAAVTVAAARPRSGARKALNQAWALVRPWTLDLGFAGGVPAGDLTHWPIAFMNGPAAASGPRVVTVHDLQHEHHPEFFSRRDLLLRRARWRPSARAADHVITISQFSRNSICERFGLPPERVSVVPLARRQTLGGSVAGAPPGPAEEGVPRLIYPASPLPAKNHERLLDAVRLHVDRGGPELRLVLLGPTMHSWKAVERGVAERDLGAHIVMLGHVDERALAGLYEGARGLIFPSLFEGFGLPVLEAMACGCPVAVSSAGSLPELVGGVGRQFDPHRPEEIADAIRWLLELDEAGMARQREGGISRAAGFSLARMASETVDVYRKVIG